MGAPHRSTVGPQMRPATTTLPTAAAAPTPASSLTRPYSPGLTPQAPWQARRGTCRCRPLTMPPERPRRMTRAGRGPAAGRPARPTACPGGAMAMTPPSRPAPGQQLAGYPSACRSVCSSPPLLLLLLQPLLLQPRALAPPWTALVAGCGGCLMSWTSSGGAGWVMAGRRGGRERC